ncbi:hypothetical protein BJV82DRAFT_595554 [Fennellomyces sp. T-0311]|nr:hypothetical protein BJV82DRAFT_595554 [Fennellomyces sp. T-0311]
MIHPLAQEQQTSSSSHHHLNAGTTSPASFANTDMSASTSAIDKIDGGDVSSSQQHRPISDAYYDPHFYAPQSPELPYPRLHQQNQQRAYSVTAMPSELQRAVLRHQQQLAEQRQQQLLSTPDQPWWQYYYQLYHYHPPAGRKPTVFGPYLLLQTLGEGEFGKVKLGIHIETGQEVAIKLIKKDNIDSSTRMSKVEREISVLRKVRHPYIVKLYDVIETERYIGIILQCASGGELFEYILAHRYLKEKDASRLFAQLISGVHYMHKKHIIHRDLKLENLLLDRNRCIIITDFGFANQFSSAKDDLMSTSCGSPCYAAPELVISEGLYVGSAVDIWSCGVILYAMLCGYLPFDDDPANPDGDNINLLYKYILNTELAFPDYVSADARDLLRKMLVPDPAKRCTMQTIMDHPWLRPHHTLFDKSLRELELEAMASAELPLPTPAEEDRVPTPPKSTEVVVPASPKQLPADQTVPSVADNNDDQMDVDPAPAPIKEGAKQEDAEEREIQKEHESIQPERPTPLAEVDTVTRDISSMELPASVHTESTSTTTAEDKEMPDAPSTTESPQPTRSTSKKVHQRGTEMIKNLLSVSKPAATPSRSSSNTSSNRRPFSMSAEPPRATQPGNSILHAKFLSSVQRQHEATVSPNKPPVATSQEQPPLSSMSTPNGMTVDKPLPQRPKEPSRTSMYHPRPTQPIPAPPTQSTSTRGTRRKALSLLVNPMTNNAGDRRTISFTTRRPSTQPTHPPSSPRPDIKLAVTKEEPRPQSTVSMAPSASEQSTTRLPPSPTSPDTMSREYKHKSAGKKLMDWFKKKPLSTRDNNNRLHADMIINSSRNTSTLGKSLGSYAVDFKDAKLRTYHGAVDQNALTSRSPQEVLVEVKQTLISMGIDVKDDGEFKLKCVRRKRRLPGNPSPSSSHRVHHGNSANDHKKRRMMMTSTGPRFRNLLRRTSNTDQGSAVVVDEEASAIIYGDPVVDPGEEVRFSMEICKIKNLPGLYIVDIRRMRGNVWSYKFLYHAVLGALDLGGKGGYMSTRAPTSSINEKQQQLLRPPHNDLQQQQEKNRISMASSSNNSSCVMDDTISEEQKASS